MRVGLAVVLVAVPLALAQADEPAPAASCDVRVVHALKEGSGIDPRITKLRPYLEKAHFSEWHQFKLLDDKQLKLQPQGAAGFELPNGRKVTLTYLDHFIAENEHRLRIRLTIDRPDKRVLETTFVLDEGGVVLQGGQKYENGRLILGITCKTEK